MSSICTMSLKWDLCDVFLASRLAYGWGWGMGDPRGKLPSSSRHSQEYVLQRRRITVRVDVDDVAEERVCRGSPMSSYSSLPLRTPWKSPRADRSYRRELSPTSPRVKLLRKLRPFRAGHVHFPTCSPGHLFVQGRYGPIAIYCLYCALI